MKYWMGSGPHRHAHLHLRLDPAEQETFFADEAAFPAWTFASDQGLSVCMQMRVKGLPLLETVLQRFPKVRVILDHFARAEAADGPPFAAAAPLFALAKYPNVISQADPPAARAVGEGQSHAGDVPRQSGQGIRRQPHDLGLELPGAPQPLPELIAMARNALSFLPQQDQDWIFFKTAQALYPALAKYRPERSEVTGVEVRRADQSPR